MPAPRFTNDTLTFLRALRRHNNREWFRGHKTDYERHVRVPMTEVIEQMAADLPTFAPELVASPKASTYRIYRDTRFSQDKTPYKTHASAIFPHRALPKHAGAGLYFHVAPDHVLVGAGLYAPDPQQLYRLRTHIASNTKPFRAIVESPQFRRRFGAIDGQRIKRVPRGFDADHPASEYLKLRQFLAGTDRPARFATGSSFYASLKRLFKQLAPFVKFLNEPLASASSRPGLH